MDTSSGGVSAYLLMRKDEVAARFQWDPATGKVTKGARVISEKDLPFGCLDTTGTFRRARLASWLADRSIPSFRPNVRKRLADVGIASESELLAIGLGLGLSDQYWIKPEDLAARWADINYFDNDFSPELGELLVTHDPDSLPDLVNLLKSTPELLGHSPDAALNGNLPKKWEVVHGGRALVKFGRADNRYQEPFNEVIATKLCGRLLDESDYVPYSLRDGGYLKWACACPCMVDANTEFVPAIQLHNSHRRRNDEDLGAFYIRICREHGLDVRLDIEKMLVVDFILANHDRHWNNFGVLMDSDSREFLRTAPIFDTGESLWCDREFAGRAFSGYQMKQQDAYRPFMRDLDAQLPRYRSDLSWFERDRLDGFSDDVASILSLNPLVANEPGRIEAVSAALEQRIDAVAALAEKCSSRIYYTTTDAARAASEK